MAAMARRKISNRGRVLAAGLCLGATGLLAGLMAATDDTGNASAGTPSGGASSAVVPDDRNSGFGQTPGDFRDDDGFSEGSSSGTSQQPSFPQPNTRSGGS